MKTKNPVNTWVKLNKLQYFEKLLNFSNSKISLLVMFVQTNKGFGCNSPLLSIFRHLETNFFNLVENKTEFFKVDVHSVLLQKNNLIQQSKLLCNIPLSDYTSFKSFLF